MLREVLSKAICYSTATGLLWVTLGSRVTCSEVFMTPCKLWLCRGEPPTGRLFLCYPDLLWLESLPAIICLSFSFLPRSPTPSPTTKTASGCTDVLWSRAGC